jgi:AraC family transcriptional regulator
LETKALFPSAKWSSATFASHRIAVEQVILTMQERLDNPLSLQEMAAMSHLSPCHFTHVFHRITGIAPREFLAALRLETAKRLLLTTKRSITQVCFDVGYNSLGTFTKRFTQFVGLAPSYWRRLSEDGMLSSLYLPRVLRLEQERRLHSNASVTGRILLPPNFHGLIFLGLFPTPFPQSRPVGCTLLTSAENYWIGPIPEGRYYLFGAACAWSEDPLAYWLSSNWLRGDTNQSPVLVQKGQSNYQRDVILRPPTLIDPPFLISLPLMLAENLASNILIPV